MESRCIHMWQYSHHLLLMDFGWMQIQANSHVEEPKAGRQKKREANNGYAILYHISRTLKWQDRNQHSQNTIPASNRRKNLISMNQPENRTANFHAVVRNCGKSILHCFDKGAVLAREG